VGASVVGIAVAGWLASRRIPAAAPSAPELRLPKNPWAPTRDALRLARGDRSVFLAILGISWFWLFGALMLAQFPGYARDVLGGGEAVVTALLAAFSVGIGLGSMLCDRLSGGRIELGLVPLGAIFMTVFGVDLYFAAPAAPIDPTSLATLFSSGPHLRALVDLVAIGVAGGLYIVPLYALVQQRSDERSRARVIAANNLLNAAFMVGSALLAVALRSAGVGPAGILLAGALLNIAVASYLFVLLPEFVLRFVTWVVVRGVYRVRARGLSHLPAEGAALLVCNHVSFVDALVLAAVSPRPIRFVMDHRIFKTPGLHYLFRVAGTIPIAPRRENADLTERAFERVAAALEAGELVCIFPEGKLTADGTMNEFKRGVEEIVARTPVPVVPLALDGLWGSFFSRKHGRAMSRPFVRGIRSRIAVAGGAPVAPSRVSAGLLQRRVAMLKAEEAGGSVCADRCRSLWA
jgi:hypothetical protein